MGGLIAVCNGNRYLPYQTVTNLRRATPPTPSHPEPSRAGPCGSGRRPLLRTREPGMTGPQRTNATRTGGQTRRPPLRVTFIPRWGVSLHRPRTYETLSTGRVTYIRIPSHHPRRPRTVHHLRQHRRTTTRHARNARGGAVGGASARRPRANAHRRPRSRRSGPRELRYTSVTRAQGRNQCACLLALTSGPVPLRPLPLSQAASGAFCAYTGARARLPQIRE